MKELQEFMDVVAAEDFVEGHEVLEDKWREWKNIPEKRQESFILKGLINGATALALKVMGRENPADEVWKTYLKYAPLIDTLPSIHTDTYKRAQALLIEKYSIFFKQKSKQSSAHT